MRHPARAHRGNTLMPIRIAVCVRLDTVPTRTSQELSVQVSRGISPLGGLNCMPFATRADETAPFPKIVATRRSFVDDCESHRIVGVHSDKPCFLHERGVHYIFSFV